MSFSLIKKGNLEHYLKTFQKELLKNVGKSTQLALMDEYDLVTNENIATEAKELGHDLNPEPITNQVVFSIKFKVIKETSECGLLCFQNLIGTILTSLKDKLGVKCSSP